MSDAFPNKSEAPTENPSTPSLPDKADSDAASTNSWDSDSKVPQATEPALDVKGKGKEVDTPDDKQVSGPSTVPSSTPKAESQQPEGSKNTTEPVSHGYHRPSVEDSEDSASEIDYLPPRHLAEKLRDMILELASIPTRPMNVCGTFRNLDPSNGQSTPERRYPIFDEVMSSSKLPVDQIDRLRKEFELGEEKIKIEKRKKEQDSSTAGGAAKDPFPLPPSTQAFVEACYQRLRAEKIRQDNDPFIPEIVSTVHDTPAPENRQQLPTADMLSNLQNTPRDQVPADKKHKRRVSFTFDPSTSGPRSANVHTTQAPARGILRRSSASSSGSTTPLINTPGTLKDQTRQTTATEAFKSSSSNAGSKRTTASSSSKNAGTSSANNTAATPTKGSSAATPPCGGRSVPDGARAVPSDANSSKTSSREPKSRARGEGTTPNFFRQYYGPPPLRRRRPVPGSGSFFSGAAAAGPHTSQTSDQAAHGDQHPRAQSNIPQTPEEPCTCKCARHQHRPQMPHFFNGANFPFQPCFPPFQPYSPFVSQFSTTTGFGHESRSRSDAHGIGGGWEEMARENILLGEELIKKVDARIKKREEEAANRKAEAAKRKEEAAKRKEEEAEREQRNREREERAREAEERCIVREKRHSERKS
ncbi:uncharacterized protein LY89DRAFT_733923 [Mollisia scopiformis]|uniref:Uncharacterized protein n=1 Tax=Mollisia scopiformis TaxID=149040 RepID=A0A194XAZ2_MOLSC|nr:uncharacterized protein LY89DRAFT_733923 [Mollisia scopiformis]KUJ16922.1 hypothetical protein LY89DRAFT_733923 [Mollisia scopiformis]